ncbi:MAG: nuclear transport factor 2 family protein [Pyrinomonadaceae bacterium]
MEQQVMKMGLNYADIIRRQDAAGVEAILADDYLFTNARGQVKTKAEDVEQYKTTPAKFEVFETSDQKVRVLGNNTAVETGTVRFKDAFHDGTAFEGSERYTTTWVWRGLRWQVAADHISTFVKK